MEPGDQFELEQEYKYYVLARILVAQGKTEEATPLVERLIESAEHFGRWGHLIGYLSLQAIAYHAQDRIDIALTYLSRAPSIGRTRRLHPHLCGSGTADVRTAPSRGRAGRGADLHAYFACFIPYKACARS